MLGYITKRMVRFTDQLIQWVQFQVVALTPILISVRYLVSRHHMEQTAGNYSMHHKALVFLDVTLVLLRLGLCLIILLPLMVVVMLRLWLVVIYTKLIEKLLTFLVGIKLRLLFMVFYMVPEKRSWVRLWARIKEKVGN